MKTIFKNCRIIDGSGNPGYMGDVLIENGKIARVGNFFSPENAEIINLEGLAIAPGFIDMHSHSDLDLLVHPEAKQKNMQGVTTELLGQDGTSIAPVKPEEKDILRRQVSGLLGDPDIEWDWITYDDYLKRLENLRTSINICTLVPYGQLRQWAVGMDDRKPSNDEIELMKSLCKEAFQHGVRGISLGLIYPPCIYADREEIAEVCKVAAEEGGFLVCHIRNEGDMFFESIEEIIWIAEKAGIPLHISHLKAAGKENWHKMEIVLKRLEEANQEGKTEISFDQYPYPVGSTLLSALLPPWVHNGGVNALLERLHDQALREKIKEELNYKGISAWENWIKNCGWEGIIITSVKSEANKNFEGKSLAEIASMLNIEPGDVIFKLLIEENTAVSMGQVWGSEEGIGRVMQHPFYMTGTDGLLGGKPHPRLYGTFPRVLGKYCREEKLFSLEEAVFHMTSFPARRLGLQDRGQIKEGMVADLVIFDPEKIIDRATFSDPHQYGEGVFHVLVNGEFVVREGKHTGKRPGKVLR